MRDKTLFFAGLAVLAGILAATVPAAAGEDVDMRVAQGQDRAVLTLKQAAGRWEVAPGTHIAVALDLDAAVRAGAENLRIIDSDLYLKQAGLAAGMTGASGTGAPQRSMSLAGSYEFAVDPLGPVAQNAVSACSRAANGTVVMSLPVVWRVTTGRFNFRWIDYQAVAPSQEIASNPDFYADQAVEE
ncbi:MAG: hypothetical protein ABL907_03375, partial [Hyphomicrobium sp.]